jgi:hypothetical protein
MKKCETQRGEAAAATGYKKSSSGRSDGNPKINKISLLDI